MERTLQQLFDFQRFEENPDLARVIDEVHARYAARKTGIRELDLSEMQMASAAGINVPMMRDKKEDL